MGSYDYGKDVMCKWIRENVPTTASVLDVGACDGKWRKLLHEYPNMDACEIFVPNALNIKGMYRDTYISDILDYKVRAL